MATANSTFTDTRRRSPGAMPAVVITPELRAHLAAHVTAFLDAATFLLDMLNAADAQHADMEPDADGEADADEASAQAATLAPDHSRAVTYRPSARQQRAAYRRNGDPIPANLRHFGGVFGSTRA